ncbi:protein odr-4 homolog isoform X2 [Venturia canescens]|uniref:protein odr-4 homolog isoform X2 n=1 Tax=Venturia canescens TaxID=32260 RepID=UPI001C9D1CF9|nr:protein odr-4 homolog isoform X2 [Venturia canescens]
MSTPSVPSLSTEQKDYVVHLARTPPPATKDVIEESLVTKTDVPHTKTDRKYIKSLEDIPNNWVADHAKHVTKMLPGGMQVLGIFVAGPGDSLNDHNSVHLVKSVIADIHRNLGSNDYLHGNNKYDNLVLSFNILSQKWACKSFDMKKGGSAKPAEWKFQSKVTKWHRLDTQMDLDKTFPISNEDNAKTLKKQLQDILKNTAASINSAQAVIEGEVRSLDDLVEIVGKKKKDQKESVKGREINPDEKSLRVELYIPYPEKSCTSMDIVSCCGSIRLIGQLVSRTFVHEKASIAEATDAVKEDIMRSLATRLEMHWDSLIEEEDGSPEENITLHEPPRRVLVELPQSKITLSDYLFPGEGPQEALISLQELLDLQVQESSVQKEIERQVDPAEFYCQNEKKVEPKDKGRLSNVQTMLYVVGLVLGFLMILISIILESKS